MHIDNKALSFISDTPLHFQLITAIFITIKKILLNERNLKLLI